MKDFVFISGVVILTLALLVVMPLTFLWSVNSLFGLAIPYTIRYILAAWALLFVIRVVTRTEVDRETLRRRP